MAALAFAAGDTRAGRISRSTRSPTRRRSRGRATGSWSGTSPSTRAAGGPRRPQTAYSLGRRLRLGSRPVPALRKGDRSEGALELTIPRTAPDGTYALTACADASDRVRERDERNNCRSSARTVVIDTTAPEVPRLDAHPAQGEQPDTSPSFAFSSEEAGVRVHAAASTARPSAACTSPLDLDGLAEGPHRFAVRARDAAGNGALQPCSTGSSTSPRRPRRRSTSGPSP